MDQETLSNHISGLGKHYFENACKIVLTDIFNFKAINVDGKNDGGTDYASFSGTGERKQVAYQITTQKSDIKGKAYRDAEKSIRKLGVQKFYFLSTYYLSETEVRKIEHEISEALSISSICLSSNQIAGLILTEGLLNKFLDETNYPLPRDYSTSTDYRELALHSYTLLSHDANSMKDGIYDDTILFVLSREEPLTEKELIERVSQFLSLTDTKESLLQKRIGALFGKQRLRRGDNDTIVLGDNSKSDILSRKKVYEIELANLSAAQTDLVRNEYGTDWSIDDSKKVAMWIAESFVSEQISNLKDIKASIVSNPLFNIDANGISKVKSFLIKEKNIQKDKVDTLVEALLEMASNHPLITKISRATVYLALEGSNPISSAKALGANRWSEFNIIIEPSVTIPYICSLLYKGYVNRYFELSVRAIQRAKKLGSRLYIPDFYINECAGHLLQARKYAGLELNESELQYSTNAFVANYYALKLKGISLPPNLIEYLSTFSPAIKTERQNVKDWVRAIMTDIQSILNKNNVELAQVPFYNSSDCIDFEKEYMYKINEFDIDKPTHLINHDVWSLKFTNDKINEANEHWIILTYDRTLIAVSKADIYKGWITNPMKFLDLTEISKPLSEAQMISLVHSVATFSERTLSIGARIIDRIIRYASTEMQNWEFKTEIEQFKSEIINNIDLTTSDFNEIDRRTDAFLKSRGVELKINEDGQIDVPS